MASLESLLAVAKGRPAAGPAAGDAHEDAARGRAPPARRRWSRPRPLSPRPRRRSRRPRRSCASSASRSPTTRVSAPTAGVVGDIPVRVGDRVTKIDAAHHDRRERRPRALHQRAGAGGGEPQGRPARPPRRRSRRRARDRDSCRFVSASVDECHAVRAGQGHAREGRRAAAPSSSCAPASSGPRRRRSPSRSSRSTASAGQFFAYVAESGDGGRDRGAPARGRARAGGRQRLRREVGPQGRRDRLIVSGVQKIGDGAPVTILAAGAEPSPAAPAAPGGKGRLALFSDVFIRRPDPGDGLLAAHHPRGGDLHPAAADRALSRS